MMNILGKFKEKPSAYHIGKAHENWAFSSIKNHTNTELVQKWLLSLDMDVNISDVKNMSSFAWSRYFYSDVREWKPYSLEKFVKFCPQQSVLPYWLIAAKEERRLAIDSYHLNKKLNQELEVQDIPKRKPKI